MDERILNDLKESYGLEGRRFSRVNGGFMNALWRVETENGAVLVKVFSAKRFQGKKLDDIERALLLQKKLHAMGVRCPRVHGKAMRRMDAQTAYMMMDYCAGHNETPETITPVQMQSLGEQMAKMHAAFDQLPPAGEKGFPIDCERISSQLQQYMEQYGNEELRRIAATWTAAAIARQEMALRHEDMTQDNVLFDEAGVTAIIDFDRACYSFALRDIGRAILSFGRTEKGIARENVQALLQGYNTIKPLTVEKLVQALRVAWLSEATWWIGPQAEQLTGKALRFREDMLWLTENYFNLEKIDAFQIQAI